MISADKELQQAERHHTDLNTFAVVASILEGGFIYTPSGHKTATRIIKICQQEQQQQLRAYEKATATPKAKATTAP